VQQTWGVFEDVFCPSEYTFNFLQDVLDEVITLFPSQYIHIGGDECPKEAWKRSEFCQQLMKKNNLKDEHALQSYFIQHIERYINSKGKKIIGWDEILEGGLAPNATVMSWRGEEGGIEAAKQNHDVIMTPGTYCYLDHSQSKNEDSVTIGGYLPLEQVYGYDPVPAVLNAAQAKHILGAQANVWTEYIGNSAKLEYMIFPRMIAMAEVLWTPKAKKDWKDFERRLPAVFERLGKAKINYSKAYYDLRATVLPAENYNGVIWQIQKVGISNNSQRVNYDIKRKIDSVITISVVDSLGKITEKMTDTIEYGYLMPGSNDKIKIIGNTIATAKLLNGDSPFGFEMLYDYKHPVSTLTQKFFFNKATGKKITLTNPPSSKYPGDGAFTLVNGVQNEKGMARSSEFLGFEGKGCEAIIDLGSAQNIGKVIVHTLHQKGSWIWRPLTVEAYASTDGINFTSLGLTDDFEKSVNGIGTMTVNFNSTNTRYIKVFIKNWSPIPDAEPGAGNNAWLFVDEIEVAP
jgi:hexosaminidase